MENVERVEHEGSVIAIIIRKNFDKEGLTFFTDDDFALQVGMHIQKKDFRVKAHKHKDFENLENVGVQEIFYVEAGKIKVAVYADNGKKVSDIIAGAGDIVVVNSGHSIECLEDSKFIEFKRGPYRGKQEKEWLE